MNNTGNQTAPNELVSLGILASAGTGKTYQLAQRYLALLALGQEAGASPGSMIALTFTRKAAQEFAQRIILTLAQAASSETSAHELATRLSQVWQGKQQDPGFGALPALIKGGASLPKLTQGTFAHLLEHFIAELDQIQLTTLDSFFTNIARTCAYELGMAGFRLLDETEYQAAQEQVLAEIFEDARASSQLQTIEHLLEGTLAGRDELNWKRHVQELLKKDLPLWWQFSQSAHWGNFAHDYQLLSPQECQESLQRIQLLLEGEGILFEKEGKPETKARSSLLEYAQWLAAKGEGEQKNGGSLGEYLKEQGLELGKSPLTVKYNRKEVEFSLELLGEFRRLFEHLLAAKLQQTSQRSRALGELLEELDRSYAQRVRSRGELSFAEMGALLAGLPLLPQREPFELIALDWQARLDARIEHWFLDEFQDTSRLQWRVLKDSLEEIIQEQAGRRTLFLVGDPKQAIYAWRGGDDRLFAELWQQQGWGEQLAQWGMAQSFRSAPAVIEMVNTAFATPSWESFAEVPKGLSERWQFAPHRCARQDLAGQACLWEVSQEAQEEAQTQQQDEQDEQMTPHWRAVAELILDAQVARREISVVVLVRKGKTALEAGEALRRLFAQAQVELAVEVEGEAALSQDSPLGLLLTDLFTWLALPADRFAWQHLQMSHLATLIQSSGGEEGFWKQLWELWQRGSAVAILELVSPTLQELELGAYQEQRLSHWHALARNWLQKGGGTLASWRQVIRENRQREYAAGGAVQVMTVHKAKGLEWDMVIVAELDQRQAWSALTRLESLSHQGGEAQESFVLVNPNSILLKWEPSLAKLAQTWQQQQAYEALCVNYVALTRAQSALHILVPPLPKKWQSSIEKSGPNNLPLRSDFWMRQACQAAFDTPQASKEGKSQRQLLWKSPSSTQLWYEQKPVREQAQIEQQKPMLLGAAKNPRRPRKTATREAAFAALSTASAARATEAIAYGTAIHQLAAQLPLYGEPLADIFQAPTSSLDPAQEQIIHALTQAWHNPSLRWAWGGPAAEGWVLWSEKSFEILDEQEWVSGVFDRVMLKYSKQKGLEEVRLVEIKTDALTHPEELRKRHQAQITLYQRVLAKLLGIDEAQIQTSFLWLPINKLAELIQL